MNNEITSSQFNQKADNCHQNSKEDLAFSIENIYRKKFIMTPFAERFVSIAINARKTKDWGFIGAFARNGKSWCVKYLQKNCGASKQFSGITQIPILAIHAAEAKTSSDLVLALCSQFGKLPKMNSSSLKRWLIDIIPSSGVEQIIIDDAHELDLNHFKLIKWLTDTLELEKGYLVSIILTSVIIGGQVIAYNKMRQYHNCIFRTHPDTDSGNIRTAFRNYPDSVTAHPDTLSK